jgi:hypothetical protein
MKERIETSGVVGFRDVVWDRMNGLRSAEPDLVTF